MRRTPEINPPICANHAVPPAPVAKLFQICRPIQIRSKTIAGTREMVQKIPRKIKVLIRAKGNNIREAPSIPDMAPLAPIIGICESMSVAICPNAAIVPQIK